MLRYQLTLFLYQGDTEANISFEEEEVVNYVHTTTQFFFAHLTVKPWCTYAKI